jgi:hypothetical protein
VGQMPCTKKQKEQFQIFQGNKYLILSLAKQRTLNIAKEEIYTDIEG